MFLFVIVSTSLSIEIIFTNQLVCIPCINIFFLSISVFVHTSALILQPVPKRITDVNHWLFHSEECVAQNNVRLQYAFSSFKMPYLRPEGDFQLETFFKQLDQFNEFLIAVVKATTKNQVADNVGDNVVDDELWIKWLSCTDKQIIRYKTGCVFVYHSYSCSTVISLYTFKAIKAFCTMIKFIQDNRFKGLLAKSKISEGWKCEAPLLLPHFPITENNTCREIQQHKH